MPETIIRVYYEDTDDASIVYYTNYPYGRVATAGIWGHFGLPQPNPNVELWAE
ncbi:MAG: hypothetical protein Q7J42_13030 [Sulfuritalea sp.]|nr:hypothetical protein [Sulfuritalea sp.]